MFEKLRVLSAQSVRKLRYEVRSCNEKALDLVNTPIGQIVDRLSLQLVESNYNIQSHSNLRLPEGISQDRNKDTENCVRILDILPGLTPADATDERIWVTLSFGLFRDYSVARWPLGSRKSSTEIFEHVLTHWFASGVRGRTRNNGIARLWWMGHISRTVPNLSIDEVLDILFNNSDYRSSLLERNSSANSASVLSTILQITKREGMPFERPAFRKFMKDVNLLGGRRNLAAMSQTHLIGLLTDTYKRSYQGTV